MSDLASDFLSAARVPQRLRPQRFGLWSIERRVVSGSVVERAGLMDWVGFESYTLLRRMTLATMHQEGEIVMEDSRQELRKHLPIWLAAHGRVLVTGLGLGCVVRGLLASPSVEHIDVVEIDAGILRVVGPEFWEEPRVTLHHGDASTYEWPVGARWDCAWHDLWTDRSAGEPHLQVLHAQLLTHYNDRVERQGAWMFPRWAKRRAGLIGGARSA